MSVDQRRFERAAHLFYEAAVIPDRWPDALQAVAEACGAAGATVIPIRPGPDSAISSPGIEEFVANFIAQGWATKNPKMIRGLELTKAGVKGLIHDGMMFAPGELNRDPYINEFLAAHRMGATAGMVLAQFDGELLLPLAIERTLSQGAFQTSEIRLMNRFVQQLRSAGSLALIAGFNAARALADTLSVLLRDVALIGGSGRVLHFVPSFHRFLGNGLFCHNGFLSSWESDASHALAGAIRRVVTYAPVQDRVVPPVILPRSERRPLIARLVPVVGEAQDVLMLARAVLIISDPDDVPRDADAVLVHLFDLTAAIARLATLIGIGKTLDNIAVEQRISIGTARDRLKKVFSKTGTHRQAELVALIGSLSR